MKVSDGSSPTAGTSTTAPPRKRLRLSGPSLRLDAARFAVRRDLADYELADQVLAPHYACAVPRRLRHAAPLLDSPAGAVRAELSAGETFMLLECAGTWNWGRAADGTVGYLADEALAPA